MELSPEQLAGIYEAAKHGRMDEDCVIHIPQKVVEALGLTALEVSREFEGINVEL